MRLRHPHYTRKTLPKALSNPDDYPDVDLTGQPAEVTQRVDRYKEAIKLYLQGGSAKLIEERHKVPSCEVIRCLNRVVAQGPLGTIVGWSALLPFCRVKTYTRTKALPKGLYQANFAGAFSRFLELNPDVLKAIKKALFKPTKPEEIFEVKRTADAVFGVFRSACAKLSLTQFDYPNNTKDRGKRSIQRLVQAFFDKEPAKGHRANSKNDLRYLLGLGTGEGRTEFAFAPFDAVQLDEHRINCRGSVVVPTPKGPVRVPIRRLNIVLLVDVYSHAILGYAVVIRREASAGDVVACVNCAMTVWAPKELRIPGMRYDPRGGLPSGVIPETAGIAFALLQVDNALAHLAFAIVIDLRKRIGCAINFGPFKAPARRWLVENTIERLEARGFERLISSTGANIEDRGDRDPSKAAVDHKIDLEELIELIDVLIANFNADKDEGLANQSPLDVLREAVTARSMWLPRRLPPAKGLVPELGIVVEKGVIRGNARKGRRPYVQIDRVKYTNAALAHSFGAIGRPVTLHVDERDMRMVRAFLEDGSELGVLIAHGMWSRTPHTRAIRRSINSLISASKIHLNREDDPVVALHAYKAKLASEEAAKQKPKRPKVSEAASDLADLSTQTKLPMPTELPSFERPDPDAETSARRPFSDRFRDIVNKLNRKGGNP